MDQGRRNYAKAYSAGSYEPLHESLFFVMEARLLPAEPDSAPKAERRINQESGQPQLLTRAILN
jgi:hypothetical protein